MCPMSRSTGPDPSTSRPALTRRRFLVVSGGLVAVQALLVACQPAAPVGTAASTAAPAVKPPSSSAAGGNTPAAAGQAAAAPAGAGGTLIVVSNSEPNPLETSLNPGLDTSRYVNDVYDRLIDYDLTVEPDSPPLKPSLATEWNVSSDGLTYTFKMRPNVT